MVFTNDDLTRLKTFMSAYDKGSAFIGQDFVVEAKLKSLVARLTAAEELIENALSHGKSDSCVRCQPFIETWRRVAGKQCL